MPKPAHPRTAYCPACRAVRGVRIVGHATAAGAPYDLARCADRTCELIWAIRPTT
ncbi:hypothetical protein YW5DRAFT_01905 [Streptomyces sp. Ncost-T6T-1]|uniref:hypothetical protein n=1 Tax=Streptomyces sp. Ncost-T6T-1 TaxID=1100828 RepID=UPI00080520FB|nr:hypothetical protein [Streptomyces sp. Ncost-T6T-1]SBV00569.1 hypothetical protein YW5DRAFT_01905 [Streptomyces sp. Ncost-T6T-1]